MKTADWERIKEVFHAALELAEPARSAYLDAACQGDESLRLEIDELLVANEKDSSLLKTLTFYKHDDSAELQSEGSSGKEEPPSTFSTDQIIAGRFKVLRFIARGGMGEVYEARDLDLGARVALKTIRPDVSWNQKALQRFKQEIQLARLVTHPNVCRMYEWGHHPTESGDINFLTMQMLEGETLAARLERQGRMSVAEALPLMEQMADALAAAHDAGVVHRDFKPGNVVLVPLPSRASAGRPSERGSARTDEATASTEGAAAGAPGSVPRERAIVTDFGLACVNPLSAPVELSSVSGESISHSGALVGTPAYMAPEQLAGKEATPATDVYALGLMIYRMLTGRRPFQNDAAPAHVTDARRLIDPLPSPRTVVADLDASLEAIVLRCLEIDPARRFASAREVVEALVARRIRSASTGSATEGRVSPDQGVAGGAAVEEERSKLQPRTGLRRLLPPSPRVVVAAVLTLLLAGILVSLFAIALRLPSVREKAEALFPRFFANPAVQPGDTVFLTHIANDTGDPQLDGVTELLRHALNQSAHFNLMTTARVCDVLQLMAKPCATKLDPATAREVAMRDGVPRVVLGTLSKPSDDYLLYLEIDKPGSDPSDRRRHWSRTFTASSKNDLFDQIREGSDWVRQKVGEAQREIDANSRQPQDITTDSWEAWQMFTKAEQLGSEDRLQEALDVLKQAIEIDPQFAMAYMRRGDLYDSLGDFHHGFPEWEKALSISGTRRLSRREELLVKGVFALDRSDLGVVLETFNAYRGYYPADWRGAFYRGYPLMMMGRTEEAIQTLEDAHQLDPSAFLPVFYLPGFNMILNRLNEAARRNEDLRTLPEKEHAAYYDGEILFMRGQPEQALRVFRQLQASKDPYYQNRSYYLQACVLAETGRLDQAIGTLEEGVKADVRGGRDTFQGYKLVALAYLYLKKGDRQACRNACLRAVRVDPSLPISMEAGALAARAGFVSDAQNILQARDPGNYHPISEVVLHRLQGEILLAEGRASEALTEFLKVDALDMPARDRGCLVRAYLALGQPERALPLVKNVFDRPGQIWQQAEMNPPGAWGDAVCQYADLSQKLGRSDASQAERNCTMLRGTQGSAGRAQR